MKRILQAAVVGCLVLSCAKANAGVIAWSGYGTDKNDETRYVWLMNDDGTNQVQLTSANDTLYMDISPDGTKIVFAGFIPENDHQYDIFVMNIDGSGLTKLTDSIDQDQFPVWSPDGTKIAFARSVRSWGVWPKPDIWVMNADGSNPTPLVNVDSDYDPTWSPDGSKLAFTVYSEDAISFRRTIYTVNADGSNPTPITTFTTDANNPVWSPDGTKVAFYSAYSGIGTVSPDGSNFTPTGFAGFDPSFSPDGTQLCFTVHHNGGWQIAKGNLDGTGYTLLTNKSGENGYPTWNAAPAPVLSAVSDAFAFSKSDEQPVSLGVGTLGRKKPATKGFLVSSPGVLDNDKGVEDTGEAELFSLPKYGTVKLNADGSFVYVPSKTSKKGTDSFSYKIRKGDMLSTATTVTVNTNAKKPRK